MRIRHSRLTRDFLQVPNATVRDDRLSHMARGILVELLSRPDGWEATADDMWRASVAKLGKTSPGRRAFRAAFAELKEYGYLSSNREVTKAGRHATVLTVTDVSPVQTDVPHAGTSVRPGETGISAGGTDVPHAGTSETLADVPHAGTSERPAETSESADGADVPHGGTSDSPAETGLFPARTDVPHGGTSTKNTENTEKKTSSSAVTPIRKITAADKVEFGNFWSLYPKSRDMDATRDAWTDAVLSGTDPKQITEAAVSYAHEVADEPVKFIKLSANWLRDRRYNDNFSPQPAPGKPKLRAVSGDYRPNRPHPATGAGAPQPSTEDYQNARPF